MEKILFFLKHAAIKIGLFLRSNWAYLLWTAVHFVLAYFVLLHVFSDDSLLYTSIIYAGSLTVALSPLGEFIVRGIEGAKPLKTIRDKEHLTPIFEEVYEEALARTPSMSRHIKLYISEVKEVNAFALGRCTIAVTRGALASFTDEEIKGVLAHEFGHMANGDTKALLLSTVGNGVFTAIIFGIRLVMRVMELLALLLSSRDRLARIMTVVLRFVAFTLLDYAIILFLFMGDVILALNSRFSEYLADSYAHQIGYGEQLKDALYLINKMDMGGRRKLKDWLRASHPYTTGRIGKLEEKLGLEEE
ncbi:MAG: M48 family metalloprotease [Oscillospiraceae bacterium]|nr:M48 family metalloprotease [Oscillospiraceae bacterium]